jgi:ribosomal protein S17
MRNRILLLCLLALATMGALSSALAQKVVSQDAIVTETAVIVAIDATNRLVSLKAEDGTVETIYAGPDILRFNELKVGDTVIFKYHESVVYAIQKPGEKPPAPGSISLVRGTGPKPAGTVSQVETTVVTVEAIDAAVPSITIKTEDGRTLSFKVEDKKNLGTVKVGDKVQITYTRALAVSVETPKK